MALPAPPCGAKLEKHQLGILVHPYPAALSMTWVVLPGSLTVSFAAVPCGWRVEDLD